MKNAKSVPQTTTAAPVEVKKASTIESTITDLVLVLTFSNGKTIEIDANTLSPDIQKQAMMHGLKQKLADAAAISRNTETGRAASVEDKFAAVEEVANRLKANEGWNKVREGGGQSGGLLLRALCELMPRKTREELAEWLAGKTDKERAALRASETIAAKIATYKPVDAELADNLLAELG